MDPLLSAALDWYVYLAQQPGWSAYVWRQVNDMAKEHPWLYWRLPELLTAEVQRQKVAADAAST